MLTCDDGLRDNKVVALVGDLIVAYHHLGGRFVRLVAELTSNWVG